MKFVKLDLALIRLDMRLLDLTRALVWEQTHDLPRNTIRDFVRDSDLNSMTALIWDSFLSYVVS